MTKLVLWCIVPTSRIWRCKVHRIFCNADSCSHPYSGTLLLTHASRLKLLSSYTIRRSYFTVGPINVCLYFITDILAEVTQRH